MSATTRNPVASRRASALVPSLARLLKIGAICAMLAAGGYATWSAQAFVVSDNAVVSAYLITLRAPIEGFVTAGRNRVGAEIGRGDLLATVANPRADDQSLTELEHRVDRLALEQAAITRQRGALDAIRGDLLRRADDHRRALVARLTGEVDAADMTLQAKQSEAEQAKRDYARKSALARTGTASAADLDKAHFASAALDREVQSLAAQLASARAQLEAATHGIMTDAGGNDVVYSEQRVDEVRLRVADLDRAMDTAAGDAAEASARLAAESHRIGLLRSAAIAAPSAGMLWKIGSSDGERLGAGDTMAELVDCGAAFLLATIPQGSYADVMLGGQARYRLSGETGERTGAVISVIGDTSLTGDRNLAAVPVDEHKPTAVVRIAVPPSRNVAADCLVGRTARVVLPTVGRGVTDAAWRLMQRIF